MRTRMSLKQLKCKIFQIEVAFSKYDVTGDEQLNYKEFCEMIHNKNDWTGRFRKKKQIVEISTKAWSPFPPLFEPFSKTRPEVWANYLLHGLSPWWLLPPHNFKWSISELLSPVISTSLFLCYLYTYIYIVYILVFSICYLPFIL